jgi:hypothetical protein
MEFEALFLGLEPVTALAVGVGVLALAPLVGMATKSELADSARETAKNTLVVVFEVFDKAQSALAEAGESLQDLVAEAKAERAASQNSASAPPQEVHLSD